MLCPSKTQLDIGSGAWDQMNNAWKRACDCLDVDDTIHDASEMPAHPS